MVRNEYRIYLTEEQHYKSVTKKGNDFGWKDLADRSRDTHLMLLYTIINHEVHFPSEYIIILAKEGTRTRQAHNNVMNIRSKINDF